MQMCGQSGIGGNYTDPGKILICHHCRWHHLMGTFWHMVQDLCSSNQFSVRGKVIPWKVVSLEDLIDLFCAHWDHIAFYLIHSGKSFLPPAIMPAFPYFFTVKIMLKVNNSHLNKSRGLDYPLYYWWTFKYTIL